MKKSLLLITFSFLLIGMAFSQNVNIKWSLELGTSTSILMHKVDYKNAFQDTTTYYNWNKIVPMPTLRLSRKLQLSEAKSIFIKPFIGAAVLGTETDLEQQRLDRTATTNSINTIFKKEMVYYYIPTAEIGGLFSFPIQNFDIEFGMKAQYHFTLWTNHFYNKSEIVSRSPLIVSMEEVNYQLENIFTRFSANAGLRVQYNFNRFLIAAESWYGITNLSTFEFDGIEVYQNELNLRLMVGYRF